jgi:2,4-dienoyl-CoA reductase-like NADH-dependent reductase (Old Yellow Enzyme family)
MRPDAYDHPEYSVRPVFLSATARTVARFFKYRSTSELADDAMRLGLDIRLSDDLAPLFRSVRIGSTSAGNSLCVQPMEGCDGTADGRPGELTYRRYQRFGAGGAKLIWAEATAVTEQGRATPRQLWLHSGNVGDFARMRDICRQAHRDAMGDDGDLLIGLQLIHSGRYSYPRPLLACRCPMLDPRTIDRSRGTPIDDSYPLLTDDDLKRLVDSYVVAAKLARDAGYDFVDVKQCHRYLLNEILGARTREGPFGGSFENRTRLARNILTAIRAEVPDLMLATRINVYDGIPYRKPATGDIGEPVPWQTPLLTTWGTAATDPFTPDLAEPLAWIGEMSRLGVAIVNVSLGNPYASPHLIRPFEYPPPDGYESPEHPLIGVDRHFRLTDTIQRAYPDLAIVGSGYSYLQEFLPQAGSANIRDGRVTFVGVGRGSLAQPDFARQLRDHGRLDRKRVCRTFSYCTALMRSKHNDQGQFPTGCPPFDKDPYQSIWQESLRTKPKPPAS